MEDFKVETGYQLTLDTVMDLWTKTYNSQGKPDWSHILPYYDDEIYFRDSIQEIRGIAEFREMTERLTNRSKDLSMHLVRAQQNGNDLFIEWESHSTRKVHHPGDGVGYLIQSPDWFVYFAGDTDRIPEMKELGSPDLAMLPIGGTFVMDPEEAAQALEWIRPRWVIPMHESKEDPAIFEQIVRSRSDVAVLRLKPGETVEV
ncbi:MAG: MBL fold metallo-hydrolase [Clostridiaceae bacterium]